MASTGIRDIREEVKRYIDHADARIVKMIHAMLEVDADADWWASMPDNIKADVDEALSQADEGAFVSHEQMKQKYPQWFTK
ncbi:hypothetical protein ACTHGU_20480 [Chitinophagaceae bacterium MMS25-I14]